MLVHQLFFFFFFFFFSFGKRVSGSEERIGEKVN
ncbi:hypothetical protein BofuT4_uP050880.1 [Botrytis cinerea T4]|uniref:Uncharacterized protein n=1 Tax=Botryotinia fuckeliana (strain T4) TaxID=999810 RepID=G2XWZ2_BOTF4|nr:hypothetical protein BofuT4_uP050880.1 [Botrytis cinerea T4]